MKTPKARIGDYLPEDGTYCRIIDITENDAECLYHLDSGSIVGDQDFTEEDIRLESEIFSLH